MAESLSRSEGWWRVVRVVFGLAGVAFLAVAFSEAWDRAEVDVLPSAGRLAVAGLLVVGGLACAVRGWAALFQVPAGVLAPGFYTAQLGKYIPGGVWQAAGQVGYASRSGVAMKAATVAFPLHALTQVAAGGLFGVVYAVTGSGGLRWLGLLGIGLIALLHRGWMVRVLGLAGRLFKRDIDADVIPEGRALVRSSLWSVGTLAAGGSAFALIVPTSDISFVATAAAWAVAWTAGFLVLIVPAGVGPREAVLAATVVGSGGVAPVIAASVVHRLVIMVGEVVMIGASGLRAKASSIPRSADGEQQRVADPERDY